MCMCVCPHWSDGPHLRNHVQGGTAASVGVIRPWHRLEQVFDMKLYNLAENQLYHCYISADILSRN